MRRRRSLPGSFNIWPAFTDVLGGLVVVLVFLITMFVVSEVLVGREVLGKDTAIVQLQQIIEVLESFAGDKEAEAQRLATRLSDLETRLSDREAALADTRQVLTRTETARDQAQENVTVLEGQTELLNQRAEELAAELERLNQALTDNRSQLERVSQESEAKDLLIGRQADRLGEMDRLIKRRLLDRVEELEQYSSDFFGRLREVFADNPDIKIVGDRFVFQSEVLFGSGEADLSGGGKGDLEKFVEVYQSVVDQLPEDLPVIIEVQGHTDRVPIATSRFASNWELSTQRALDVVNFLIDQGIPPERLAAVGMGEYHPIDDRDTPEAYRRNRRIELKITSR